MRIMAIAAAFAMTAGCSKHYAAPRPDEARSLIVLSFAYDHAALSDFMPSGNLNVSIWVQEGWHRHAIYSKSYRTILSRRQPVPLEKVESHVHASRDITVHVWLGVNWQTSDVRIVDSRDPGGPPSLVSTEVNHSRGCEAALALKPEKDKTYRLDYSSAGLDRGCVIQIQEETSAEISGALYQVGGQHTRNM